MNDFNAKLVRYLQTYQLAKVSAFSLSLLCTACGAEGEGSGGGGGGVLPFFDPAVGGASTSPAGGGVGNAPSGAAGGNGPTSSSAEQPAGNGTVINASGGAGASSTTNGGGGSNSIAAGGNGMTPSEGGAGQTGMPPTAPCENDAFFCEDFDGLALGTLPAGVNGMVPERTVSVIADSTRGQLLQVLAGAGYGNKAGIFLNGFAPPGNSYFGRMFVNVAAFPVVDSDHWVIVEATGNGGDQVRPVGGQFQRWAPGADGPSAGDWTDWQQSNAVTLANTWECVEWQMNGANGGNDILLWVDDEQVQPLDRANFSFPTMNRLWIGWVVYQMGEPSQYDVRIDDIALSTQRIGCN